MVQRTITVSMPSRRFGIAADDGVTYIIVVQETPGEAVSCGCCHRCLQHASAAAVPGPGCSGCSHVACSAAHVHCHAAAALLRSHRSGRRCLPMRGMCATTTSATTGAPSAGSSPPGKSRWAEALADSRQADLGKGMVWQEAAVRAAALWASPTPTAGF